jgi:hypothetical protein
MVLVSSTFCPAHCQLLSLQLFLARGDIRYVSHVLYPRSFKFVKTNSVQYRRLARRGGVKRISANIYDEMRISLKKHLTEVC